MSPLRLPLLVGLALLYLPSAGSARALPGPPAGPAAEPLSASEPTPVAAQGRQQGGKRRAKQGQAKARRKGQGKQANRGKQAAKGKGRQRPASDELAPPVRAPLPDPIADARPLTERAKLARFDTNKNKRLDPPELREVRAEDKRRKQAWSRLLRLYDRDKSGALEPKEMERARGEEANKRRLAQEARYDLDKDGTLSLVERQSMLRDLDELREAREASSPKQRQAKGQPSKGNQPAKPAGTPNRAALMKRFDANGDGQHSPAEMQELARYLQLERINAQRVAEGREPLTEPPSARPSPEPKAGPANPHGRTLLERYDENGNGKLDPKERAVLKAAERAKARAEERTKDSPEPAPTEEPAAQGQTLKERFDADGDGALSDEEKRSMRQALAREKRGQEGAKDKAPEEGKPKAKRQAKGREGLVLSPEDQALRRNLAERYDADGDGRLSDEEQASLMEDPAAQALAKRMASAQGPAKAQAKREPKAKARREPKAHGRPEPKPQAPTPGNGLSPEDEALRVRLMEQYDADGNGRLSKAERQTALQDPEARALAERMAQAAAQAAGAPEPKSRTAREASAKRQQPKAPRRTAQVLRQRLMTRHDVDGDGALNPDELAAMLADPAAAGLTSKAPNAQPAPPETARSERGPSRLERYDADGDGRLSGQERAAMLAAEGPRGSSPEDRALREALLARHDLDGDGQLSETERQALTADPEAQALAARAAAAPSPKAKGPARPESRLARFDADGDGQLSREERVALRAAEGPTRTRVSPEDQALRQRLLARHDLDGDGQLSETERQALDADPEAQALAQRTAPAPKQAAKDPESPAKGPSRLARFDADGDGQLSREERLAMRQAEGTSSRWVSYEDQELRRALLQRHDADGDGELTPKERASLEADDEYRSLLARLSPPKPRPEPAPAAAEQDTAAKDAPAKQDPAKQEPASRATDEQRRAALLRRFDKDKDGELSEAELSELTRFFERKQAQRRETGGEPAPAPQGR